MRRNSELKERFLERMRFTAHLLRVALDAQNPTARRVLLKRVERRLFDEAQVLMKAGYPRLAERIAAAVALGEFRWSKGDDPPPAAAMVMAIPPIDPPSPLQARSIGSVKEARWRRKVGIVVSGKTPPSSLAVALAVPGRYGMHSIVLRGDAKKPNVA